VIPFLAARQLRERFVALGHFYELQSGRRCRSVLELLSHARAAERIDTQRGLPDAVVVMMNPGSSRPLREDDWAGDLPNSHPKRLVPAHPDTTQYQVMRVMARMHWEHVRILNLSDLHESKSSLFVRAYPALGNVAHSIFMTARRPELASELQRKDGAPLVLAWGVHPRLKPLIEMALEPLHAAGRCCGVQRQGAYLHPLPRSHAEKLAWVHALCTQLLKPTPILAN
jgi:hypothetical protein